ncbi:hypothetical protein [Puerhibacterium puerhi]|uniref:hypothetical protein n=1 Tax=Puerhibacterium puerhi TaxID=2692623 RepID=UPI00135C6D2D|nr:hypothetical protein [Puerhibacterium puerhi]
MTRESRPRRRIREAVESRGYRVKSLEWEPIYYAGEMSGYAGGWTLALDRPYVPNTYPGDELGGLSVEVTLADIDWSLRPSEPCGCYPEDRPGRHPLHRIKGDPERPLHEPGCRWHIAYRPRWWKDSST